MPKEDWENINVDVESSGNVLTVTMEQIRNAHGAAKLGVHVRTEITSKLAGMGIGTVPKALPINQHQLVRLYKRGTPAGDLIEAVLEPGEQNDKKLAEQLGESDVKYAEILDQIRDLVSE